MKNIESILWRPPSKAPIRPYDRISRFERRFLDSKNMAHLKRSASGHLRKNTSNLVRGCAGCCDTPPTCCASGACCFSADSIATINFTISGITDETCNCSTYGILQNGSYTVSVPSYPCFGCDTWGTPGGVDCTASPLISGPGTGCSCVSGGISQIMYSNWYVAHHTDGTWYIQSDLFYSPGSPPYVGNGELFHLDNVSGDCSGFSFGYGGPLGYVTAWNGGLNADGCSHTVCNNPQNPVLDCCCVISGTVSITGNRCCKLGDTCIPGPAYPDGGCIA